MEPRIAATDDNRFVMAWEREVYTNDGWLEDIYYTIRDTNGNVVKGTTRFTNGVAGDDYYQTPTVAALNNNRALLAYSSPNGLAYAVINSAGNTVKGQTLTGGWGYSPDAVQLSDGNIVIAWPGSVEFVIIDGTTYNKTYGPEWLHNPASVTGDAYISVAADQTGHAILTWMDYDYYFRRNLYYALLDGNGNTLTDPMIFYTSQAITPRVETNYDGYGNTSWSADLTPPTLPTLNSTSHVVGNWSVDNTVEVTWSGASDTQSGVDGYAVIWDHAPTTVPNAVKNLEENIQNATSAPLTDGDWYFHIRTVDNAGNGSDGAAHLGPFKIDTTPPESSAHTPEYAFDSFSVSWGGADAGSGIVRYDVQVRDGDGIWATWRSGTTDTSDTYTAIETGHTYYFRSVAQDLAGNIETDLPVDGDTQTTIAAYTVAGQVTNNRAQPIFNATVIAQPAALGAAATDANGDYTLYLDSSGTYTLTADREGFGTLPPRYNLNVTSNLDGIDLVLPPETEAVTNGGWESGDMSGWKNGDMNGHHGGTAVTPTIEMTAAHTGRYGLALDAGGGTLRFWPYVTQTLSIPEAWSQPTLSFMYRVRQGESGDALLAVVSGDEIVTHTVALTPGDWTHTWRDLSALAGQRVTLQFGFQEQTAGQAVYLDEISVGESQTGVYIIYLPLLVRDQ